MMSYKIPVCKDSNGEELKARQIDKLNERLSVYIARRAPR